MLSVLTNVRALLNAATADESGCSTNSALTSNLVFSLPLTSGKEWPFVHIHAGEVKKIHGHQEETKAAFTKARQLI